MIAFRSIILTAVLVASLAASAFAGQRPLVAFANPGGEGDVFFQPMTDFMQAAADDLGFKLKVFYGNRNHVLIDENIRDIFQLTPLPDYVIGMNARGSGMTLLDLAERHGVETIFVNQSFLGEERTLAGKPGEKYKDWLFEFLPDDAHSGYLLANRLIEQARRMKLTAPNGKISVIAISGHAASPAAILRERGLARAVADNPDVDLHQVVHADWRLDKAKELSQRLLSRYPDTAVVWSASDKMAVGVTEAIREAGQKPGTDILTGGIDWAAEALDRVQNGDFSTTVGGHFMDGAWALVMLYDMIHNTPLPRPEFSRFSAITADNVYSYKAIASGQWDMIDFTRFTKYHNPALEEYNFGLDPILNSIKTE